MDQREDRISRLKDKVEELKHRTMRKINKYEGRVMAQ